MINFFANQKKQVMVKGKGLESVVLGKSGRGNSIFKVNHVFTAMLGDNSEIVDGDILLDGEDNYFVVAVRIAPRASQAQLYKANGSIDVARIIKYFEGGTQKGFTEDPVVRIPTLHETITATIKQFDVGLLPNTVKRFLIADYGLQLLDRFKFGAEKYQVDAIDDSKFPGFLSIQCSIDKRVTK